MFSPKKTLRTNYFNHKLLEPINLTSVTGDTGRFYTTPEGNVYPSVTTVLGSFKKEGIEQWRARVGEEEANRVSKLASSRGTAVHKLAEDYLLNKDDYDVGSMPSNAEMFNKQIKTYLDQYCDEVYGIESALYSDKLKTAGRCDLIARIHNIRTIGDFKTSAKLKREEWIENYFLQCATYAIMLKERYNLWAPQICVMIATDEGILQPFVKQTVQYVEKVNDLFADYHKNSYTKIAS
jgi:hypothetical protein